MKNLMKSTLFIALACYIFVVNSVVTAEGNVANPKAKIVNIINPSKSVGIQIGDLLNRQIEIEVAKPYQISKNAFPVKGTIQQGVELNDISVSSEAGDEKITYKIALSYQVFTYSDKPSVVQLPVERFDVTTNQPAGKEVNAPTISLSIPAWRFWQSSLVSTGITNAKDHVQPQYKSTYIDLYPHQVRLAIFAAMFLIGLIGLIYVNADQQWLPFMNGAFAQAHRQIKRLNKNKASPQKALLALHQAFNKVYGANLFAGDIDDFVAKNRGYVSLKPQISRFFELSNNALFSGDHVNAEQYDSKFFGEFIVLSQQLRYAERGVK